MKNSYYRIAIERYFSTPVPYFLLLSVPLMMYGYFENGLCFWLGLGLTVAIFVLNHFLMYSLTRTFGVYATKKEVDYVSTFVEKGNDALTEKESVALMEMMASQMGNSRINVKDYIRYINHLLEEKAQKDDAEALYWLGVYHHMLGESKGHNEKARELILKSAELGCERAKKLQKRAKKWI